MSSGQNSPTLLLNYWSVYYTACIQQPLTTRAHRRTKSRLSRNVDHSFSLRRHIQFVFISTYVLWISRFLCKALHKDCFLLISARLLHKSCVIKSLQAESWCGALALFNNYRSNLDGGQLLQYLPKYIKSFLHVRPSVKQTKIKGQTLETKERQRSRVE